MHGIMITALILDEYEGIPMTFGSWEQWVLFE